MSLQKFHAAIKSSALKAVAAHWMSARKTRLMPAWKDIDAVAIGKYLHLVWAWRYDFDRNTFIGRLAGDEILAVLGKEIRGRSLEECFPANAAALVLERYKSVIDVPQIMHSTGNVHMNAGKHGSGERIVLPLATDGIRGDGVLGATEYHLDMVAARMVGAAIDHHHEDIEYFPLT
jgi:hypothetical protein